MDCVICNLMNTPKSPFYFKKDTDRAKFLRALGESIVNHHPELIEMLLLHPKVKAADRSEKLSTWGILELMGHRRLGGNLSEQSVAGKLMVRIDIPVGKDGETKPMTQFYSPDAVYCITPSDEATARAVARANQPEPVYQFELLTMAQREETHEEDHSNG